MLENYEMLSCQVLELMVLQFLDRNDHHKKGKIRLEKLYLVPYYVRFMGLVHHFEFE